jgi:predicted lipoprotein with Yx(FWY)xxD motif
MKRPIALFALALALVAGGATAYAVSGSTSRAAKVKLRTTSLGKVLVDSHGRTLYRFMKDKTSKSRCNGACAVNWPPLRTTGRPHAGRGVKAGKLGTTTRRGGSTQVTYARHPLYTFAGDARAGQTNGQGLNEFGGRWYAVKASGARARRQAGDPSPGPTPYPGY